MQELSNYEKANKLLLDEHKFEEAFKAFEEIALDESKSKVERADAFHMLGLTVSCFAPYLDEDESGLKFFKKAVELDPDNFSALVHIAEGFGPLPCDHQDINSFKMAADKLLSQKESKERLSKRQINRILEKKKIIEKSSSKRELVAYLWELKDRPQLVQASRLC